MKKERTKALHPGAFGVMHHCTVLKRHNDNTVTVEFDLPYPRSNKRKFRIPTDYLQ